jgi:hypothetical protein
MKPGPAGGMSENEFGAAEWNSRLSSLILHGLAPVAKQKASRYKVLAFHLCSLAL